MLVGYGLFLLAFRLFGGEFVLTKPNLLVFSAALLLVGFTYGLLWTVAGCETAGMRFAQLRLTNFDGFPPERKNLVLRFVGGCMSFSTLGLGVLWSLFDEEGLTWQDHISGTFPHAARHRLADRPAPVSYNQGFQFAAPDVCAPSATLPFRHSS